WGGGGPTEIVENVTTNNYYGDQTGGRDVANADYNTQDASYDPASYDDSSSGFDGGFDDSTDV
ncbi:MAG TPA: hypothetical protein VN809_06455, partial [Telmatospirillum sp.]|nr:hypothetical protein [Telmatospirillum sp.]